MTGIGGNLDLGACIQVQELLHSLGIPSGLYGADGRCLRGPMLSEMARCDWSDGACRDFLSGRNLSGSVSDLSCPERHGLVKVGVDLERGDRGYLLCCLEGLSGDGDRGTNAAVVRLVKGLLGELIVKAKENKKVHSELEALTVSLAQSYEEMSLLHQINDGMKVTQRPKRFFSELCLNLREVLETGKVLALWYDGSQLDGALDHIQSAGVPELDLRAIQLIWRRTREQAGSGGGVLIDGQVDGPMRYEWPDFVRSLISVPIVRNGMVVGALAAVNKSSRADFDSTDSKLLASVANEMGVFLENFRLYNDLQDLLMGSLRALTSSIDAKDPYTCGHSERVALVARRLAEVMSFSAGEVHDIYLTGLLHDVGKIGVREDVLCKPGRLVEEEYQQIRRHPQIGARILSGIRQMGDVSGGVLTHHERFDGMGYPQGLRGRSIPMSGRIVMLADCFDAMISDRTYRKALPPVTAQAEIRRFGGTQFDPDVAEAFLGLDLGEMVGELDRVVPHQVAGVCGVEPVMN